MITEKIIIIKGGSYNDVKKALRQWIDLYLDNPSDDFRLELYKNGRGRHIVKVDQRVKNDLFFYLVNYLKYPEGIEYNVDIEGFTTGEANSNLDDQELLVYISENDKEYDNVYIAYKVLFKREPEVNRNGKFADVIYTLILLLGLTALPFLIIDYLK